MTQFLKDDAQRELDENEFGERKCSNCILRVQAPFLYCQFAMSVRQMVEANKAVGEEMLANEKAGYSKRVQGYVAKIAPNPIDADDLAQICRAFVPIKPLREKPQLTR